MQRVQAGTSKSAKNAKTAGIAGRIGSSKSVGTAGRAGTPQVAVTATTSTRSALAASPDSTGIKEKGCKSARTSRRKRGGGVSLLACRQYRRGTSAKGDAIRIGIVSIRNHPQLDRSPPSPSPSPSPSPLLVRELSPARCRAALTSHTLEWLEQWGRLAELELKWSTCELIYVGNTNVIQST